MLVTKDLIIKKGEYKDWKDLYNNIWRHSESTKYMLWKIITSAADFFRDELGAKKMILSYRSQNIACKKMQEACGFVYSHSVDKIDPRDGQPYVVEYTVKELC